MMTTAHAPSFTELHRVLRQEAFAVSFYGWLKVDMFFEWNRAGFRVGVTSFSANVTLQNRRVVHGANPFVWLRKIKAHVGEAPDFAEL
jgi:hypothetical protein